MNEAGSGVRHLFKYCKAYCSHDPQLIEQDIFKFKLPLTPQATGEAERTAKILEFCGTEKSTIEIMDFLGLEHREYFRLEILYPLLDQGLLHQTIPDKPTSPKQKYYSVIKGKNP